MITVTFYKLSEKPYTELCDDENAVASMKAMTKRDVRRDLESLGFRVGPWVRKKFEKMKTDKGKPVYFWTAKLEKPERIVIDDGRRC